MCSLFVWLPRIYFAFPNEVQIEKCNSRHIISHNTERYSISIECKLTSVTFSEPVPLAARSKGRLTHGMPFPYRAHAVPLPCRAAKALECVFPFDLHSAAVSDSNLPCRAHAIPDHAIPLKATAQHDRREMTCWLPARIRLLPAITRSSTKGVIRRIPISHAGGQCETKRRLSWTKKTVW